LSYLANTQTDKQTNRQTKSGKNITSLAEVITINYDSVPEKAYSRLRLSIKVSNLR